MIRPIVSDFGRFTTESSRNAKRKFVTTFIPLTRQHLIRKQEKSFELPIWMKPVSLHMAAGEKRQTKISVKATLNANMTNGRIAGIM